MTKKLGLLGAALCQCAVLGFSLSMLFGNNFWSYCCSLFIALSYVTMAGASYASAPPQRKAPAMLAVAFGAMYGTIILLVYFAQMTTVRSGGLTPQAASLLDFQQYGLFFSYDMLGYALLSLSTVFLGLSFQAQNIFDKWRKGLLLGHGVFFISCFLLPLTGLFSPDMTGGYWIGVLVLEFWCAYFTPICLLTIFSFYKVPKKQHTFLIFPERK